MSEYFGPMPTKLALGTVMDVLAGPRWYAVRFDDNVPAMPCRDVSDLGVNPFGPRKISLYSPGSQVYVAIPLSVGRDIENKGQAWISSNLRGYILGGVASSVGNTQYRACDWIAPFVGVDAMNMTVHSHLLGKDSDCAYDHNANQPLDVIPGSDQGVVHDFGLGYGVSRFFTWLRASELAGIWCFYYDNLTRLAAYNYEFWHSGGEQWIKNDEGEINDVDLFSSYPWEAMGCTLPNVNISSIDNAGGIYKAGQSRLWNEPAVEDQLALPRGIKLRGYLGDFQKEMVCMPSTAEPASSDLNSSDVPAGSSSVPIDSFERYSRLSMYTGLLDVQRHINGLYSVRSAQGIVFEKYLYLPVPKQLNPPENKDGAGTGDGTTNYRPSGYWGNTTVSNAGHHKEAWRWGGRPNVWHAELFDYHAYMFNWYGVKTLNEKAKDWWLPNEGEFDAAAAPTTHGAYVYSGTLNTFTFSPPAYHSLKVDHRTGTSKYYFSRSIIAQLPDGTIVVEDGYGSSLVLSSGNIHMSCAGDIWMQPGRSFVCWAPDDFIARAGSSADITASTGDVRLKAERNLHFLGGNSGRGGVLIESRGVYYPPEYDFEFCAPYCETIEQNQSQTKWTVSGTQLTFTSADASQWTVGKLITVEGVDTNGAVTVLTGDIDSKASSSVTLNVASAGTLDTSGNITVCYSLAEADPVYSGLPLLGEEVSTPGIMLLTRTGPLQMYATDIYGKAFASGRFTSEERQGGMWLCDDNAASTTVVDAFGNYDGTAATNTSNMSVADGHSGGRALKIDSTNGVTLPSGVDDGFTTFAVSFWIRGISVTSGLSQYAVYDTPLTSLSIMIEPSAGTPSLSNMTIFATVSGGNQVTVDHVDLREWMHIAVVDDGVTVSLYVNGVLMDSGTGTTYTPASNDFNIAASESSDVFYIDSVVISPALDQESAGAGSIVWDAESDRVDSAGGIHTRFANDGMMDVLNGTLCDHDSGADSCGSSTSGNTMVVNRYTQDYTYFGSCNYFRVKAGTVAIDADDNGVLVNGTITASDNILGNDGSVPGVITSYDSSEGVTDFLTGNNFNAFAVHVSRLKTENCEDMIKGDPCFIDLLSFSLRPEEQYGLDDTFVIAESRWQQIYRMESFGSLWTEPAVEVWTNCSCQKSSTVSGSNQLTYPHPGELWTQDTRFLTCDTQLWGWTDTRNPTRGASYDTARTNNGTYDDPTSTGYGPAFSQENFDAKYHVSKTGI